MYKKTTLFLTSIVMMLFINANIQSQTTYVFNSALFQYGTVNLSTGAFTSLNFFPTGASLLPVTGDNIETDEQYAIMSNYASTTFYLWDINFNTLSGDSIGIVGPLASGQTAIKGMAYNSTTDTWYVVSSNDFGTAAYLYTLNITNAALTQVAQLTGANLPVAMAINCNGTAYIIDVVGGMSNTGILKTLDLTTGATTAIGTDIGLADIAGSGHDMDFNPETGNLYWGGYWSSGFFSSGGTFRQIDVTTGTSTEILPLGQYENYISFSVNGLCPVTGPVSYVFNSALFSYGTVDLSTGAFTSLNFFPTGSSLLPVTGDNIGTDEQYAIMSNYASTTFYLWDINFNTLSGDSIGIVSPLASGQTVVKGMAYNSLTDTWYVVSSNDFGTAAYLYTLNITNASLTQVAQLTGANLPVAMAINCEGTAYIIDVVSGTSNTGILKTLDLSTGTTTAIGTDIGLANIAAYGHDMDFNPETGNLYWGGYWSSGFFSSGGSFRQIDIVTGTSTEILALGQYENYVSFSVNGICEPVIAQGWQWINTGYNFILYDVSFPPGQSSVGYAVGSSSTYNGNGIILKSTDGGNSWNQISVGTIPGLEAVCFTSTNVGYAGGWQNYFIKTTDGGATWNQININAGIWYFKEIEFWDANNGMTATADPQIYVTTDAGNTWTPATGLNQGVEDITYVNSNLAYVVGGDEKISRSTNGGLNWTQIYSGIFTYVFLGVDFYDANYGMVSGEDGKVLVTTNGGTNWTTTNAGGFGLMRSLHIFNPDSAYVVGTPEQIFKTTNSGSTWVEDFTSGYQVALYKIKFLENNTGIICGSQGKFLIKLDYVPVELTSFSATAAGNNVYLIWATATEMNNSGFNIERSTNNSDWENIGFVPGFGTSTEPRTYSYNDAQLSTGLYSYRLKQIDFDGSFEYSDVVRVEVLNPNGYLLAQNYPNPFNPSTTIEFSVAGNEMVNLTVYNLLGEKVAELVNEVLSAGQYKVNFNAAGLASGIYIVKMTSGSFVESRKMNLLK
jgi:photosystem II stability/assembly factor-like uncharacterized protein